MASRNTRFINVKTLGMVKYEVEYKSWLVSLDQKFGLPFVNGKVVNNDNAGSHHYKVECEDADGLSSKVPSKSTFLSEMLILDGLSRKNERTITTIVHDTRLLHISLETINVAGIGYTSFTHYPTNDGEESRPPIPMDQYVDDVKCKVIDAIIRTNHQR
jgi:hypothetical protein